MKPGKAAIILAEDAYYSPCPCGREVSTADCLDCLKMAFQKNYENAIKERDLQWIEEADRGFEGVRNPITNPEVIEGWAKGPRRIPAFVLHEIWKRDPRVKEAVDKAVNATQEACCKAICPGCRHREPLVNDAFAGWVHRMPGCYDGKCAASPIHNMPKNENENENDNKPSAGDS